MIFNVFVSNHVYQIQQCLLSCTWRYVRSDFNPADCASRGLLPTALLRYTLYWLGPEFLRQSIDTWKIASSHSLPDNDLPETKVVSLTERINTESE